MTPNNSHARDVNWTDRGRKDPLFSHAYSNPIILNRLQIENFELRGRLDTRIDLTVADHNLLLSKFSNKFRPTVAFSAQINA